jgi:cation diffusion facilitator CzcD-associated flavoprotein CzcO
LRAKATARTVVVGAGPYGLSVAAHLRAKGIDTLVFGPVMEFWRRNMPRGMLLRSPPRATHIAAPKRELTLEHYARERGRELLDPLPVEDFIDYGDWFQQTFVPDADQRRVHQIRSEEPGFRVLLADGEELRADRVVVAAGLYPFPRRPAPLSSLPPELVSHSADHDDLTRFAGRRVLVVGGGQSAVESAALLHEGGAEAELVARAPGLYWLGGGDGPARRQLIRSPLPPTGVGGRVTGWIAAAPDVYRCTPEQLRPTISFRCIRPAAAGWLRERTAGLPMTMERSVTAAEPSNGGVRVEFDDGSERRVDHVLLATGYEVDIGRYPFLSPELLARIERKNGYPRLRRGLESSVPGLHFVGAPAAGSFGPIMRFVVGSWYAAPAVARRAAGERQPPLRLSF